MWIAVMGLMMLTGGGGKEEQGQGFDDFGWRRGQGGMEQTAANESSSGGGAAVTVIAGPPVAGSVSMKWWGRGGCVGVDAVAAARGSIFFGTSRARASGAITWSSIAIRSARDRERKRCFSGRVRRKRSRIGGRGLHRGRRLSRQEHRSALAGQAHGDAARVRAGDIIRSTPSALRALISTLPRRKRGCAATATNEHSASAKPIRRQHSGARPG